MVVVGGGGDFPIKVIKVRPLQVLLLGPYKEFCVDRTNMQLASLLEKNESFCAGFIKRV